MYIKNKEINRTEKYSRYIILFTAITFIFVGILREEDSVVLQKAINICLECIGIG